MSLIAHGHLFRTLVVADIVRNQTAGSCVVPPKRNIKNRAPAALAEFKQAVPEGIRKWILPNAWLLVLAAALAATNAIVGSWYRARVATYLDEHIYSIRKGIDTTAGNARAFCEVRNESPQQSLDSFQLKFAITDDPPTVRFVNDPDVKPSEDRVSPMNVSDRTIEYRAEINRGLSRGEFVRITLPLTQRHGTPKFVCRIKGGNGWIEGSADPPLGWSLLNHWRGWIVVLANLALLTGAFFVGRRSVRERASRPGAS